MIWSVTNLALWKYFSVTVFNKFKLCYSYRCVKKFFGFHLPIELSLPSADTVIYNSRVFTNSITCVITISLPGLLV